MILRFFEVNYNIPDEVTRVRVFKDETDLGSEYIAAAFYREEEGFEQLIPAVEIKKWVTG